MAIRLTELSELLGLFYEGVVDAKRWEEFLNQACKHLNYNKAAFSFHDAQNRRPTVGASVGITSREVQEFESYYGSRNPAAADAAASALRNGSWHSVNQLSRHPEYLDSEYYEDFLRPHGLFHSAMSMASIDSRYLTTLMVVRPRASGVLGNDAAQFIELFTPHMARAFQIQAKLDTLNVAAESTSAALDRWDTGLIALDRHARVVGMNAAAEAMVKTQRALLIRQDTVAAVDEAQQPQLNKLIAESVRTGDGLGMGAGGALQLQGKDSTPVSIVVTPFRSERLFAESRPCALLFIVDPSAKPLARKTLLRVLYGLTPAESRLVSLLLEGLDLKIAAEHLRVTTSTARFMLKQVFHKTSTHRQSQLIRLLSSLPGDST